MVKASAGKQNPVATEQLPPKRDSESGALTRGLALLAVMVEASRPLSLSEISELAGLAPSTCHRILQSLLASEHIYRCDANLYAPGGKTLAPLALEHPINMLRRDAVGVLRKLQDDHGASALLIAFLGTQRMMVDFAPGRGSVAPYFDTHIVAPYHTTVSGKLMLSAMSRDERQALVGAEPLLSRTDQSIVSNAELDKELDQVAAQGWAFNRNENVVGISAVGVRLLAPSGRAIGALVLSGLDEYFTPHTQELMVADLQQASHMLTRASLSVRAMARFLKV
jgi:DNA-binding IclR family transcriptional regulator